LRIYYGDISPRVVEDYGVYLRLIRRRRWRRRLGRDVTVDIVYDFFITRGLDYEICFGSSDRGIRTSV
jgi:hypothetical protein